MKSPLEQFDSIKIIPINFINIDFSFYHILLPFIFINLTVCIVIILLKNSSKLIPDVWQYILEYVYIYIYNIIKIHIGYRGYIYIPYIYIMFNFVLLLNLCGLMPLGVALTSYLVLILYLSFTLCSTIFILGLINQGLFFLKLFIPQSPLILLIILIPIEIFSYFIRMFSLGIRLVANILAGHTLVYIIATFLSKLIVIKLWFYLIFCIILLLILGLEFCIAFLQAYVFTTLICIYLSEALNKKNH